MFVNAFAMTVQGGQTITLAVAGDWSIRHGLPSLTAIRQLFAPTSEVRQITMFVFATLSYGQTSTSKTPGANPEFPTAVVAESASAFIGNLAGAPTNAPTPQEQITKTPGSSANPEFPTARAPSNAPTLREHVNKTPGSTANSEFPKAGAPLRDKKD
jgi:hypothetical protein